MFIKTKHISKLVSILIDVMKIVIYIFIFLTLHFSGQNSSGMDSIKVKKNIDKAKELTLDGLLTFYLKNTKHDIKLPRIRDFHQDNTYTYFIRSGKSYKALNSETNKFDFIKINGDSLLHHLFSDIVPKTDREKGKSCMNTFNNPKYKCKYLDNESIQIILNYKISCDFVQVLNKIYIVNYNIKKGTNQLILIAPGGHAK